MKPAVVILAAGASRRLGEPKALAEIGGERVLDRLLAASASLDEAPPLVVTGAHHAEIVATLPRGVECAWNADWAAGRTGGILLAASLRAGRDLLLAPVDVPLVTRDVFDGLGEAWKTAGAPPRGWLAPRCGDRYGHPIVVGRELIDAWRAAPADRPLRELRALARPLLAWDTVETAVLDDLDTPEALAALRAFFSLIASTRLGGSADSTPR